MELTSHFNARLNHSSVVSSVFTEKENTFLTANRDGTITIVTFQPKFRQNSKRITHSEVTAMAYETNNYINAKSNLFTNNQQCLRRIILGTVTGDLLILSNKLEIITTLHQKHFDRIVKIQFFDNNKYFLTASYDCSLKIFDAHTYKYVSSFYDHQGWITDFSISPNEKTFITACADQKIRLFDIKKKRCIAIFGPFPFVPTAILFHPEGKHYFIGFTNGVCACYKIKGAKKVLSVQLHQSSVTAISMHKSGKFLASVSVDSTISILEVEKATILFSMLVKQKGLNSVVFSNDGWQLMTTSISGRLTIWDFPFNGLVLKGSSRNSTDNENDKLIDNDNNSDENCFPEVLPRPKSSQTMPSNFQMQNNMNQNLINNMGQFSYTQNPPNAIYMPQMINQQGNNIKMIDPNLEKNPYEFSDSNSFTSVEAQQVGSSGEFKLNNQSSSKCVEVVRPDIIIEEEEEEMEVNSEDELITSEEGSLSNKSVKREEEERFSSNSFKKNEEEERFSRNSFKKNEEEEERFSSNSFMKNEEEEKLSSNRFYQNEEEDKNSNSYSKNEELENQRNNKARKEEEEEKLSSSNSKNDTNENSNKEKEKEFSNSSKNFDEGKNCAKNSSRKEEECNQIIGSMNEEEEIYVNNSLNKEEEENHQNNEYKISSEVEEIIVTNDSQNEEEEEKPRKSVKSSEKILILVEEEEEEDSTDNIQYIDTDEFTKKYKKEKEEEERNSIKSDFVTSSSLSSGHDETENKITRNDSENISLNNSATDTFNEIVIEIKPSNTEESLSESTQDLLQNFSFTAPTVASVETVSSTQNAIQMNKTESLTSSELHITSSTIKSKLKSTDSHHDEIEDFNAAFTVHSSSINTESPVYDFNNYSDKENSNLHEEEEEFKNEISLNTKEVNNSNSIYSKLSSSFPALNSKTENQNQIFNSDPAQFTTLSNNVFSYLYRSNHKSNESSNDDS